MAGGNLGDLWFNLGVRENVSKELNKVLRTVQGTDGSVSKLRLELQKVIDAIVQTGDEGEALAKKLELRKAVSNAMDYLSMLQRIKQEEESINGLKQVNKGVNTKDLDLAQEQLSRIKKDLMDLQSGKSFGGVDAASLSMYQKALRNTLGDVSKLKKEFEKENSLSVMSNNAARLKNELSKVESKLADIYSKQSYGFKNGIDTGSLLSAGNSLRGVQLRIKKMLNDPDLLTNTSKYKSLISDISYAYTKATGKVQEFNRSVAANKEATRAEKQRQDELLATQKRIERIGDAEKKLRDEISRGVTLQADTSKAESRLAAVQQELLKLENIKTRLESGDKSALGILGRTGDERQLTLAKQAQQDQKSTNDLAESQSKLRAELDGTIARLTQQREALEKNAAVAGKFREQSKSLDLFNNAVRYSKAFGGDQELKSAIANKEKEIRDYNNKLAEYAKDISEKEQKIKGLSDKIAALNAQIEAAKVKGEPIKSSDLSTLSSLKTELGLLESEKRLLEGAGETINSQRRLSILQDELDLLKQIQAESSKLGNRDASSLKKEVVDRNKELLQSEKQYTKELAAKERQRQKELEDTKARIQSLSQALRKLESEVETSKKLNVDTTAAEDKILRTREDLMRLRDLMVALTAGQADAIGKLGSLGNGTEVKSVNETTAAQRTANKEKEEAIKLEEKHRQEVAATAAKVRSDLVSAFEQANKSAGGMRGTLQDLKSLFLQGGLVYGAKQFFDAVVQTGGEIEKQHIALRSILGDRAKADELFEQTQQLALQSPFKFGELNKDVKQLAAFGVEANNLYDTTKRLADISAGLGVDFSRLGLAYGQVKARSWLDGKELRQFAYAGLPLLKSITDLYNQTGKGGRNDYTEGDVKKMISNREVSFEDVQKVLWGMTDEGGKFYNMQFVLSETLLGKWNKLIDAWEIMMSKFADGDSVIGSVFKTAITGATNLVLAMDKLSPALIAFGAMFAMKKGWGMLTAKTGIGAMAAQMKAAQTAALRTYAAEQQNLMMEGRISAEKAKQNVLGRQLLLTSKATVSGTVSMLALQGKMTLLQMQRAFREKLIGPELVKQLQTLGLISAKESELIMKSGMWSRGMLAARQAWNGISGLFTTGNLVMMGLTAAFAIWQKIDADQEKVKQRAKDISDSARDHAQSMAAALKDSSGVDTSDPQKLQQTNDALKDVLEQSGMYTDTIKEQVEQAETLVEQYKVLKKAVEDAKNSSETEDKYSRVISDAISESGRGLWNNDITENAQSIEEQYQKLSMKLDGFDSKTREKMNSVADSMLGPKAATMTLEEKIIALNEQGGDAFEEFARKVDGANSSIVSKVYRLSMPANKVIAGFKEIANDDIPGIIRTISASLGISENDFRRWASKNVSTFDTMFSRILSLCNIKVPSITKKIREIMYESLKLQDPQKPQAASAPPSWKNPLKTGSVGKSALDKLSNAGKLKGGKGGAWYKETAELINSIGNSGGNSWHDFGESLQKMYKDVRNENNSAKKAGEKQPYYRKQQLLEMIARQIGVSLDVGKDRVTGDFGKNNGGSKEDKELDALKDRVSLYKTYYSELQKYRKIYGEGAETRLKGNDDFKPIAGYGLTDSSDYRKSIEELTGRIKQSTQDRKAFVEKARADISGKDRQIEEQDISDVNSELKKKLDLLSEEYDAYKKLYELTGDREGSQKLSFGRRIQSQTMKESLRMQMDSVLPGANARSGQAYNTDEVLAMSESEFKDAYGENSKEISVIFEKYKNELTKIKKETLQLMTDLISNNRTIDQQIEDLAREHDRNLKAIKESDTTPEMKQRATEGENKSYQDKDSKLQLQKFKEEENWVVIFDDLGKVGNKTLDDLARHIDTFSKDTSLSVAEVKELRDALRKLQDEHVNRNPFSGMFSSGIQAIEIGKYMRGNTPGADGKYNVSDEQAKKMGIKGGKYSKAELEVAKGTKDQGFSKSLDSLQKKFQALSGTLDPVLKLMDALGSEDTTMGDIVKGGSDAFGAAASFSGGLNSITSMMGDGALKDALGAAGPYGAAASAAISIIGSFAAAHDAALQKEIEASQQRQKEMENLTKNIEAALQNMLGGIYSYSMDSKTKSTLQKNMQKYSKETQEQISKALSNTDSAFDAEYASLMAQKEEVEKQRAAESKKKKKDTKAIADYDQQITEMNQQITDFVEEWAKSIYDIDLKDWASQLTDAIVEAWSKGEDAADAYHDTVQSLMKDLTKNIISQKVLEVALEPLLDSLEEKLTANKGKLTEDDVNEFAKGLLDIEQNSIDNVTAILDKLKAQGLDLSENGSLSTSNSIKSVTEETADLLASYINAIRLDVSVNRESITKIAEAVEGLPKLNVIAQSQLTQLNNLVSLATVRNERLDQMYDWMRGLTNGTKKISVA